VTKNKAENNMQEENIVQETKNKKHTLEIIFFVVCLLVLIFTVYKVFFSKKKEVVPVYPPKIPLVEPTVVKEAPPVIPTHSTEEIEIISKIETKAVNIADNEVNPKTLEVKKNDQVQFFNKSSATLKVIGEGWGNIPLSPGENLTQSFKTAGKFSYQVIGLSAPLTGEVVVK